MDGKAVGDRIAQDLGVGIEHQSAAAELGEAVGRDSTRYRGGTTDIDDAFTRVGGTTRGSRWIKDDRSTDGRRAVGHEAALASRRTDADASDAQLTVAGGGDVLVGADGEAGQVGGQVLRANAEVRDIGGSHVRNSGDSGTGVGLEARRIVLQEERSASRGVAEDNGREDAIDLRGSGGHTEHVDRSESHAVGGIKTKGKAGTNVNHERAVCVGLLGEECLLHDRLSASKRAQSEVAATAEEHPVGGRAAERDQRRCGRGELQGAAVQRGIGFSRHRWKVDGC